MVCNFGCFDKYVVGKLMAKKDLSEDGCALNYFILQGPSTSIRMLTLVPFS